MKTNKLYFHLGADTGHYGYQSLRHRQMRNIVYRNGRVYTVNTRLPWAEAVAIKDDRFVFVGKDNNAAAYIGPETRVS